MEDATGGIGRADMAHQLDIMPLMSADIEAPRKMRCSFCKHVFSCNEPFLTCECLAAFCPDCSIAMLEAKPQLLIQNHWLNVARCALCCGA